jgi:nucleoid-associated protein YgaU
VFTRLLKLLIIGLVMLIGCAKPPTAELEEVRQVLALGYASGAAELASEQYQAASEALRLAEEFVRSKNYPAAETSLTQARDYARQALQVTRERKAELAREEQRLAEEKAKAAELARLERLKKQRQQQQAKPKPKPEPKPVPKPSPPKEPAKPKLVSHVEVGPAENLLMIAARPEVYDDGELWPLIYKANRDQIKDPTEIFPGQTLLIPRDKSAEEIEAARIEARESKLF